MTNSNLKLKKRAISRHMQSQKLCSPSNVKSVFDIFFNIHMMESWSGHLEFMIFKSGERQWLCEKVFSANVALAFSIDVMKTILVPIKRITSHTLRSFLTPGWDWSQTCWLIVTLQNSILVRPLAWMTKQTLTYWRTPCRISLQTYSSYCWYNGNHLRKPNTHFHVYNHRWN